MTVQHLWYNGIIHKANHSVPGEEPMFDNNNPVCKMLDTIAVLCNRAQFKDDQKIDTFGDASESALLKFVQQLRDAAEWRNANQKLVEIPFNSVNKFQVSVHRQEGGVDKRHLLVMKGAPERIVARCSFVYRYNEQSGKPEEVPITEEWKKEFTEAYENLGGRGERVLGFAHCFLDEKRFPDNYGYDPGQIEFTINHTPYLLQFFTVQIKIK